MRNREIKFRAWDDGAMIYEKDIKHLQLEDNQILKLAKFWCNIRNDSKVMQFTGLLDKNGKEIYEGDIVDSEKWVGIGRYEKCRGVIKFKIIEFTIECVLDWSGSNAALNGNAVIIGNIYQTPELLKP